MESTDLVEISKRHPLETVWDGLGEVLHKYFRVEIEGIENIPSSGPAVIVPNHSGFAGTDVIVLSHLLAKHAGRRPRILAHRAYFDFAELEQFVSKGLGLRLSTTRSGVKDLKNSELLMIFPEGNQGNFKSSLRAYQLQAFHSGFLRMAVAAKAPIVPVVVIGAEESHLSLGSINLNRFVKGYRLPIPMNMLPLPAKWKVRFLKPIYLDEITIQTLADKKNTNLLIRRVRARMQRAINAELKKRQFIFHPRLW